MKYVAAGIMTAALAVAPTVGAAAADIRLVEAGGARFPDRSYVLTLPGRNSLPASAVTVRENGERVTGVAVTRAGDAAPGRFATVLLIDWSNSMRGPAVEAAMDAARAFAARRATSQKVGIVAFNGSVDVLQPLTTDSQAVESALSTPPRLAERTRIYDAVDAALRLLRRARVASGSVVVLSDGSDVGSVATPSGVLERAKRDRVRVFTVGLRSRTYDPETLSSLATGTSGLYREANAPEELAPIFDELGFRLANEYLLRYRSLAGPAERVHVTVSVDGVDGVATAGYETPALPARYSAPFERPLSERIVASPLSMVAVALFVASLFAAALVAIFRPRPSGVRERVQMFVSAPSHEDKQRRALADRLTATTERSLAQTRWWTRFKEEVEIAEISMAPAAIVLWTVVITGLLAWGLPLVLGTPVAIVLAVFVPIASRGFVKYKLNRRRQAFAEQLPDNLEVLAAALRAGHSLMGALSTVVDDAAEPSRSEFRRVIADEQLGVPLDEAIGVVVRRMDNADLDQVALVAQLQRDTGSGSAEVLDRVIENIRGRQEVRRLVRTLTAQGRLSRWVLTLIPVAFLLFITLYNYSYVEPLFERSTGRAMLVVASVMVIAGSLVMRKLINIRV